MAIAKGAGAIGVGMEEDFNNDNDRYDKGKIENGNETELARKTAQETKERRKGSDGGEVEDGRGSRRVMACQAADSTSSQSWGQAASRGTVRRDSSGMLLCSHCWPYMSCIRLSHFTAARSTDPRNSYCSTPLITRSSTAAVCMLRFKPQRGL